MATETTAKAINTRRIQISPKTVRVQPYRVGNHWLFHPKGGPSASKSTGRVDATKTLVKRSL